MLSGARVDARSDWSSLLAMNEEVTVVPSDSEGDKRPTSGGKHDLNKAVTISALGWKTNTMHQHGREANAEALP